MSWQAYEVLFRLRSPMHIGWGKVGNLQRTRPYVTGRVFWGALTLRLTRNDASAAAPATGSSAYQAMGEKVHHSLAYTYFYPALGRENGSYALMWPWEAKVSAGLLGSYASTALSYPQQAAAEGMLHEVEFISPNAVDTGEPVLLAGYVFESDGAPKWRSAIGRIQLGGERGYGWGRVELVREPVPVDGRTLFGGQATLVDREGRPAVRLEVSGEKAARLLAHARTTGLAAEGYVEPVVGREWRSTNETNRHAGQHVEFSGVCFAPGARLLESATFEIGRLGIWEPLKR